MDSGGSRNQLIEFSHKKLRHAEYQFKTREKKAVENFINEKEINKTK